MIDAAPTPGSPGTVDSDNRARSFNVDAANVGPSYNDGLKLLTILIGVCIGIAGVLGNNRYG